MPAPLYSWDRWFSTDTFTVRRRKDYRCSTSSMVQQIRNAASARGIQVEVEESERGDSIEVRVHRPAGLTTV